MIKQRQSVSWIDWTKQLLGGTTIVLLSVLTGKVWAIEYRLPTAPVKVRPEAGSNGVSYGCPATIKPPVLLMPQGHVGETIQPHPVFFAFLPGQATVQFLVIEPGVSNTVYAENIQTQKDGVVRLTVPSSAPALKPGKTYWWYVSVLCDPKYGRDRSYLQGWVRRVNHTPQLMKELEQATVADRPAIYARNGLWFDALRAIADEQRRQPQSHLWKKAWADFLKAGGLEPLNLATEAAAGSQSSKRGER